MRKFAQVISNVFDPLMLVPLFLTFVLWESYQLGDLSIFQLLVIGFLLLLFPGILYLWMLATGKINDPDISKRELRLPLFTAIAAAQVVAIFLSWFWKTSLLSNWLYFIFLTLGLFFVITAFWKISIHVGMNSLIASLIWFAFGGWFALLFFVPLLISWARVTDKQHTWLQCLAGAVIPFVTTWLWTSYFGLLAN